MSGPPRYRDEHAESLRLAFDRSFSHMPVPDTGDADLDCLAIRVGAFPYVLRLSELAGVLVDRSVTPVPGSVAELLGIAGVSGRLVAVYDLAALLGHAAPGPPRWLALAAGRPGLAFAFHQFDGHSRVSRSAIAASAAVEAHPQHVGEAVHTRGHLRPIIGLPSLILALERRGRGGVPPQEG